ncbi:unnamed protein product, partial [Mesorhabditis belari]|uniref:Cyclin N-terminal domain-containing protein n=1 Tax=Mesorhabditis belari TaxID=2138241 RepID=A0AAF3F6Q7_9BILA
MWNNRPRAKAMNIGRPMRSSSFRSQENRANIIEDKNVAQKSADKLIYPVKQTRGLGLGGHQKNEERKTSATVDQSMNSGSAAELLQYNEKAFHHVYHPEINGPERELSCVDYSDDVFTYLQAIEKKFSINEGYLNGKSTTGKMRAILVDWIVQVHHRLSLLPETLSLAIYVLDAYLTAKDVPKTSLQLTALTSVFIAAKYEEMYTPDIREFEVIGDGQFSKRDILSLEPRMLMVLECCLYRPAHITFLRFHSSRFCLPEEVHKRAQFFIEICMQYYQLCHLAPSHMVLIAISLATAMDGYEVDMDELLKHSDLKKTQMENWRAHLAYAISANHEHTRLKGISTKYASSRYLRSSDLSIEKRQWLEKQFERA